MNLASRPEISDLPIVGIAGITFKVSDLTKARAFYQGVLGLAEAFKLQDDSGDVRSVYFKVNDEQYIEVTPDLEADELIRQARIVFQSSDVETLHAVYNARGVHTGRIEIGRDGNPVFHVPDPEGNSLSFLQYVDGSQQVRAHGRFLDSDRVSRHIPHVGVMIKQPATTLPFYYEKLGFSQGRLPGERR